MWYLLCLIVFGLSSHQLDASLAGDELTAEFTATARLSEVAPFVEISQSITGELPIEQFDLAGPHLFSLRLIGPETLQFEIKNFGHLYLEIGSFATLSVSDLDWRDVDGNLIPGTIDGISFDGIVTDVDSFDGNSFEVDIETNRRYDPSVEGPFIGNIYLSVTHVPEPATYLLLGAGLSLAGVQARRKARPTA